jgi:ABC-2 type transport system permease protein
MSASAVSDFLQPVAEQVHPLFNPTLNYRLYLSYPFCFILLQVLLLLLTTYVLGIERKEGTAADWLRGAQGRVGAAVAGKLAPYWLLFAGVSLLAHVLFFGYLRLPTVTSPIWLWLGSLCFLASTQAVALCFYALLPVLGLVFSGVSMFGSLGATLSGVTFPLRSMPWPVEWASYLFPLRYFVELSQQWMMEGMEHWTEALPLGALLLFLLPAWGLLPRLKKIYQSTS